MSKIVWRPPPELVEQANITRFMAKHGFTDVWKFVERSTKDLEWFWEVVLEDLGVEFAVPYRQVMDTSRGIPWTDWYVGGKLNLVSNCLERHARGAGAGDPAVIAESEDGQLTQLSFGELASAVDRCAGALLALGVERGDRVGCYMPMVPEVVIQMLATLKIGAIFIPIFSGYAPAALAERLRDAEAKVLFTADVSRRRGQALPLKPAADEAVEEAPSIQKVVVLRRTDEEIPWDTRRDLDWEAFLNMGNQTTLTELMASMEPALILYTSGTTGRPKGTVHSHAGTLVQVAKEVGYAFDLKPSDRFFWLTDIGWMMGPWMILGGLFHHATIVLYEGAFDYPSPARLWEMVSRHRITVFGVSPTAIRSLMRAGREPLMGRDLTSLRILGSTGEPWDESSWLWYFKNIGGRQCPVINISGGTDIIGCFLSPLPLHPLKPCTLVGPGLGMAVDVWNDEGKPIRGEVGYLVATQPAPSMTRGLWRDAERYLETYWSRWENVWNHGDWALIDSDGYWFLMGRADDTLKVAGRRIGPAEIEGVLIGTGKASEAAAIGVPHPIKGEGIVCFVVLKPGIEPSEELRRELAEAVVKRLGKIDRPEKVLFVADLPKTRSAKILRRLVRAKYLGQEDLGDLSSLQNPEAVEAIANAV